MKRVVITGMGAVTPIGKTPAEFWESLKAGRHGFAPITAFDTSDMDVKIAAEVKDFDPSKYIDKKEVRRTDRFCQFAVVAALDALEDSGTDLKDLDPYRVGVIVGSGIGGLHTLEAEHTKLMEKGPDRVSVFFIPMMISNMAAGTIAMKTGFKGLNYCPVTACATSSHAIGEAFHAIKHGYLDACITGGSEATITRFSAAGFNNMKALSKSTDPDRASIPFDADRDGFVMGEGGAILVLEELEHAKARGAHIYAEIVGYGATCDAYHMTSPSPEGEAAAHAMKLAMEEAGVVPEEVGYLNAHGTSTGLNDKYETKAVKLAFGEAAEKLAVSSTKSMTGHLLGAAGAVESIACALALEEGVIPPTIGYQKPDPECDLDYVTEGARKVDFRFALSNSLGFGGHNATLCLKKYEG
ncbi:MAG: beta-ketoacyl-[acyl-carrier-protein] synthase II [Clostridiales bacterium]|nr:MAG: beta-ketoacyl-[acyl-carrier-protein] synthase II [Clostridiales bacterium]